MSMQIRPLFLVSTIDAEIAKSKSIIDQGKKIFDEVVNYIYISIFSDTRTLK